MYGRLNWLSVSFLLHVKHTVSHRIVVSYRKVTSFPALRFVVACRPTQRGPCWNIDDRASACPSCSPVTARPTWNWMSTHARSITSLLVQQCTVVSCVEFLSYAL